MNRKSTPLPLFPLSTVLYPGGLLPLKIFEQRYIDMAKTCLKDSRPFGVCLITQGNEVATPRGSQPEFSKVGTQARIVDFDVPQLGILHVATKGETRFQVQGHVVESSGLIVGEVTPIPAEPPLALAEPYAPLASLLELIASRVGPQNFPVERDYGDASWVGYRLAELLPLPLHIKQSMLEINDAGVRLKVLQQFLTQQGLI
ncbi:MAG: LON peptidase substrate-binding domain-containing protein [Betaproteobacteria bacterium]